ncbi:PP2C family protein-serine/threonine phosphatase [Methanogenium organophilum]|uniref:Protein phosphatase 2C domain-containing protein n=1 Tax=Methanogenium organophilum TaxID=2199 RepID=A0A9X9T7V2_METOG|nr:protein phosphatase 2C domain-containing protein [Methanogenium organophilum]WAI01778.1 protein phosphatase 2C domain-containing protein [Methanogenium organophilum]
MRPDTGIHTQFAYSARSVAGVRSVNEDAWCATRFGDELVCAVADGIGGHEAGDVASALAIRIFSETVQERAATAGEREPEGETLRRAHTYAHAAILAEATGKRSGMGTTLVSAWFTGETVSLCNSGDSRCTLIRADSVCSLTKDHSLVQDLVDRDVLSPEEAASHPMKNIITHSLGGDFIADCTTHVLCPNDTLVLSSDGLHDYVSRETMIAAGTVGTAEEAAALLLEEAAETSTDNITLIVVRVPGGTIHPEECDFHD